MDIFSSAIPMLVLPASKESFIVPSIAWTTPAASVAEKDVNEMIIKEKMNDPVHRKSRKSEDDYDYSSLSTYENTGGRTNNSKRINGQKPTMLWQIRHDGTQLSALTTKLL